MVQLLEADSELSEIWKLALFCRNFLLDLDVFQGTAALV